MSPSLNELGTASRHAITDGFDVMVDELADIMSRICRNDTVLVIGREDDQWVAVDSANGGPVMRRGTFREVLDWARAFTNLHAETRIDTDALAVAWQELHSSVGVGEASSPQSPGSARTGTGARVHGGASPTPHLRVVEGAA
jgi:hypothetical protein